MPYLKVFVDFNTYFTLLDGVYTIFYDGFQSIAIFSYILYIFGFSLTFTVVDIGKSDASCERHHHQ